MRPSETRNGSFKYHPLTEPDSIRLILLKPASSATAQIECNLLHTTLSIYDREIIDHYTALSYVWGDPLQTKQISVDGYTKAITVTLEAALRDLRESNRILRVWADALCIDQSNIEERNQQVRHMGRIYSTAHHTVIYLGPLTPPVESILKAVPSRSCGIPGSFVANLTQVAENSLLNRPWFGRVWVFQELVLSRDPWVQCGKFRVRWTDLCDLLLSNGVQSAGLKLLEDMHLARERRVQTNLFHLLLQRRGLGATDARDIIFAHLGVASDRSDLGREIDVDYQQSCERVYEDAARYVIDAIGPGNIFFHISDINHNDHRKNLASWAPDWSLLPSPAKEMYKQNRMNVVFLKTKPHYTFIQEPSILGYIGYEVDIISDLSLTVRQSSQQSSDSRMNYQRAVQSLQSLYASVGGTYASGDENGQYTHIPLQGKEKEHERLCLEICNEWVRMIGEDVPSSTPSATKKELESHKRFVSAFSSWSTERARQGIIFVGECEGIESIMYYHLYPNSPLSILNERRLAVTKSGRVAVVPAQAREGDIIAYLAGIPVSVVVRATTFANPEGLNHKIVGAFNAKRAELLETKSPYTESFMQLLQTGHERMEHCRLIGESYIEGVIGWSYKERHSNYDFKIFALH